MAHIPTQESDVQKVIRIAKELDISIEDAAVTCAGFELAFSDESTRRQIFEMIDELDDAAYKKGEPLGLIVNYAVEVGTDGIRVGRYADEVPPGEVVHLTPTNRAVIFLRIKDNFPTQQFLGPMIVNRPRGFEFQIPDSKFESEMESEFQIPNSTFESEIRNPKSEIDDWMVCSDESEIRIPKSEIDDVAVRSDKSQIRNPKSKIDSDVVRSDKSQVHIPKSQIYGGVVCSDKSQIPNPKSQMAMSCRYPSPVTCHLSRSAASGLSPPLFAEIETLQKAKDVQPALGI